MIPFFHNAFSLLTNANFTIQNFTLILGGVVAFFQRRRLFSSVLGAYDRVRNATATIRELNHTKELLKIERTENKNWRQVINSLREQSQAVSEQLGALQTRLTEVESILEVTSANEIALFTDRTALVQECAALRQQLQDNHIIPTAAQTVLVGLDVKDE